MAAVKTRHHLTGLKVVCVMSGGNLNMATLRRIVSE
jgi:threonine dehydratase